MSEHPVLDENGYFFGTSASMHELIETWANGGTTEDFLSQHQDVIHGAYSVVCGRVDVRPIEQTAWQARRGRSPTATFPKQPRTLTRLNGHITLSP